MMQDILVKVLEVYIGKFSFDGAITIKSLELDALDFVEFISSVEDEFEVKISNDESDSIVEMSLADFMKFVEAKK